MEHNLLRTFYLAAGAAALLLSACGDGGGKSSGGEGDRFAGLDQAILAWKADIEATHESCKNKVEGTGCVDFQVACKAERAVTEADRALGVTERVVAAFRWQGWNPAGTEQLPAGASAEFDKIGGEWARKPTAPVNPTSCQPIQG
ncbi:MAG: hypothetical protein IT546_08985 [Caulobacteraceae bacterium]|nr:hypothetical protein [Caulobacteraceae bacterium]